MRRHCQASYYLRFASSLNDNYLKLYVGAARIFAHQGQIHVQAFQQKGRIAQPLCRNVIDLFLECLDDFCWIRYVTARLTHGGLDRQERDQGRWRDASHRFRSIAD